MPNVKLNGVRDRLSSAAWVLQCFNRRRFETKKLEKSVMKIVIQLPFTKLRVLLSNKEQLHARVCVCVCVCSCVCVCQVISVQNRSYNKGKKDQENRNICCRCCINRVLSFNAEMSAKPLRGFHFVTTVFDLFLQMFNPMLEPKPEGFKPCWVDTRRNKKDK